MASCPCNKQVKDLALTHLVLSADYTSRRIPGQLRDGFIRSNEVLLSAFLPQLLHLLPNKPLSS